MSEQQCADCGAPWHPVRRGECGRCGSDRHPMTAADRPERPDPTDTDREAVARLTPTEDLVMEVLAGRFRTGEDHWTFETRHRPTMVRLAARGLIHWKEGIVEDTVLAWFTDAGREAYLMPGYAPPAPTDPAARTALIRSVIAGGAGDVLDALRQAGWTVIHSAYVCRHGEIPGPDHWCDDARDRAGIEPGQTAERVTAISPWTVTPRQDGEGR